LAQNEELGCTGGEARRGGRMGQEQTAMISASDYYTKIAKPTVDDFLAHNDNVRLAFLACVATLHVIDYVAQNREPDDVLANQLVDRLKAHCREHLELRYCVVEGFALASKHCRLSRDDLKGFHSGRYMLAYPAIVGVMRAGESFIGDETGGVTIHWKEREYVNLAKALTRTLAFYEAEFTEVAESR
jgi:hypothetical protein